jgi:hypothetical protein
LANKRPYRRKLSNYLLDKSMQLRYVLFVTVLSAVISGSLGYLIYEQEREASEMVTRAVESPMFADDPELRDVVATDMKSRDTNLALTMVGVGLGLVVVLSLYLVVMTHKVAGPLYKVSLYFRKWEQGTLGEVYPLRKGDMLKDFYDDFKVTHDVVRKRQKDINALAGRFIAACDAAGIAKSPDDLGKALERFRTYQEQRKEALG